MSIRWPKGLNAGLFLQHYWQQRPLLIKNAFPDFDNPLDENELAGLALDEEASSRFVECIDGHEWRMSHGPFDDAFFSTLNGQQWSLLISDVEKLLPDFRRYLAPFRFLPDWRIDDLMISYAPVGGSVGAHIDQYDVFLLQASGVRQWQYETTARELSQNNLKAPIALLSDLDPDETHDLQAGDMLYLPPKFAHHGIAIAEPCMTWSVGFRAPSSDEMLPSLISYLLDEIVRPERFTDARRPQATDPGLITQNDFSQMRQLIRSALQVNDDTLDSCIGRFLCESSSPEQPDSLTKTVEQVCSSETTFVCNIEHKFAYKAVGEEAQLFANGECFLTSLAFAQTLCSDRRITTTNLAPADRVAATLLVNQYSLIEDDE